MAEDRLANCRSDKGSSRRLAMISRKPFQNASSTLTHERSTTDEFMARLPRRSGGNLRLHWRLIVTLELNTRGCMPSLDFGNGGAMIRSANDARRRRDAAPLPPSEHAAQEVENARVVRLKCDDGPRARRRRAPSQDTRSQTRHPLPRRLQQGR